MGLTFHLMSDLTQQFVLKHWVLFSLGTFVRVFSQDFESML
jgi:hypothetical protein